MREDMRSSTLVVVELYSLKDTKGFFMNSYFLDFIFKSTLFMKESSFSSFRDVLVQSLNLELSNSGFFGSPNSSSKVDLSIFRRTSFLIFEI